MSIIWEGGIFKPKQGRHLMSPCLKKRRHGAWRARAHVSSSLPRQLRNRQDVDIHVEWRDPRELPTRHVPSSNGGWGTRRLNAPCRRQISLPFLVPRDTSAGTLVLCHLPTWQIYSPYSMPQLLLLLVVHMCWELWWCPGCPMYMGMTPWVVFKWPMRKMGSHWNGLQWTQFIGDPVPLKTIPCDRFANFFVIFCYFIQFLLKIISL